MNKRNKSYVRNLRKSSLRYVKTVKISRTNSPLESRIKGPYRKLMKIKIQTKIKINFTIRVRGRG